MALIIILICIFFILIGIGGAFLFGSNIHQEKEVSYTENETYRDFQGNVTVRPVQKTKKEIVKDKSSSTLMIIFIILTLIGIGTLVVVPGSIHTIQSGQVAVVKVWGEAKEIRNAGIHYDGWLSHKYEIYDSTVQQVTITTSAYSSDGQTMDIELVVQYQIQPENVIQIYKNYGGLSMIESRIETISIEKMKSVLSRKSAMTIIETRASVSPDVETAIRDAITQDFYVNITTVVLTDISFTDAFEKTVEDKMIAEQEKLKAEYEKEKAIIQAEQALEVAKLDAQSKLAEAQGKADSMVAIAQAEANSTKLKSIEVARMLGFTIIETNVLDSNNEVIGTEYNIDFTGKTSEEIKVISDYIKYIEYLNIWNGELPQVLTDNNASIIIPTN